MDVQPCLPDPARLVLLGSTVSPEVVWLDVESQLCSTPCPRCEQLSARPHSRYPRILKDVSLLGKRVRLRLTVRKYFCDQADCPQRIFCERPPTVSRPWGRTTARLDTQRHQVALEVGAESAARVLAVLGSPVSADTLLTQPRRVVPAPAPVRQLGIDDWAWRKGHRYGTILVDLERHQVIDLLPDRDAATLTEWLKRHPEIELITRDRAGVYQQAAACGAPQAQQVADRWHLLKNLREILERYLQRVLETLKPLAQGLAPAQEVPPMDVAPVPVPPAPVDVHPPSPHQQARFQAVKALLEQGRSIRQVATEAHVALGTVRKYKPPEHHPGTAAQRARRTLLAGYRRWLSAQWNAGHRSAVALHAALRDQGYLGGYTLVRDYCRQLRLGTLPTAPRRFICPSARTLSWAVLMEDTTRMPLLKTFLDRCRSDNAEFAQVEGLLTRGWALFRQHLPALLPGWLTALTGSGVKELQAFAVGIDRDYDAIRAALELPQSNGQVEGQVNRLKTLKRSMYGRAGLGLLRARVLHRSGRWGMTVTKI